MMYLGDQAVGIATSLPEFANIAKIECGSYTPTEDEDVVAKYFSHSLGTIPDFIFCRTENFTMTSSPNYYLEGSMIYRSPIITQVYEGTRVNSCYVVTWVKPNTINEVSGGHGFVIMENNISSSGHDITAEFHLPTTSAINIKLKANVTYRYIIGKFKEVTPNA